MARFFSKNTDMSAIDAMDGATFEQWCANVLRANGFKNIKVTGKSGDQGVDIIATKAGEKYAIQCKRYSSTLGNAPIQEVYAGKQYYGCDKAAVMTNQYFTNGAINLARTTDVMLWDRNTIVAMQKGVQPQEHNTSMKMKNTEHFSALAIIGLIVGILGIFNLLSTHDLIASMFIGCLGIGCSSLGRNAIKTGRRKGLRVANLGMLLNIIALLVPAAIMSYLKQ